MGVNKASITSAAMKYTNNVISDLRDLAIRGVSRVPIVLQIALYFRAAIVWPIRQWRASRRAYFFELQTAAKGIQSAIKAPNSLRAFAQARQDGRGIWKWNHYFDVYDRHLSRFRNTDVSILEIGIFGGGSLDMWRDYFGPSAKIYGVDIQPSCRAYATHGIEIFIGDQANREFWQRVRASVPRLDIVIDDGGHRYEQQVVSLQELLPFIAPGGVYICEDIHGGYNGFASYVHGLGHKLNDASGGLNAVIPATAFQQAVASIHLYPFVTVIERNITAVRELTSTRYGTQWEPFIL